MKARIRNLNIAVLVILATSLMLVGVASASDPSDGLLPTARVYFPNLGTQSAKIVPPSFSVGVMGSDPDSPSLLPAKYRYLLTSAQYDTTALGEPSYIRTPFEFNLHADKVLSWDDPSWSAWTEYPTDGSIPEVGFVELPDSEYFLFAVQAMDADGAVSIAQDYQVEVMNFQVREGAFRPYVTWCEPFLGCPSATETMNEIASGQPLNFSWIADASAYGGTIVSYRHGWDLIDPADPNDQGWAVPPGLAPENLFSAERSFTEGFHTFYLRVEDDSAQVTLMIWRLLVIPFVSRDNQFDLLLIDQTVDHLTNQWQDQSGVSRDKEEFRNAYWHFLADGSGGVAGFNWERDRFDHTMQVSFSDLVKYKAVLCYARTHDQQTMYQEFRPVNGNDKYVWLTPYQQRGGNYFQVGGHSMDSFLETQPNYMIPIIFDATETTLVIGDNTYIIGFGQKEMPDGSVVRRGPRMYPYATAGITAMDYTSPATKFIYGREHIAKFDRDVECVGLKGLALDGDFRTNHAVGSAAIADTFFTDPTIDWEDAVAAIADTVNLFNSSFPFRNDEFVNANISTRPTPIFPQECDVLEAPDGMCVEPMFTGISRMDWMREHKWERGDPAWPQSQYSEFELEDGCGPLGLTSYLGTPNSSARTNGWTYGYLSYKMIEDKPVRKADVYWGFDPYRFDQAETKKAVRWVLEYFGVSINP